MKFELTVTRKTPKSDTYIVEECVDGGAITIHYVGPEQNSCTCGEWQCIHWNAARLYAKAQINAARRAITIDDVNDIFFD